MRQGVVLWTQLHRIHECDKTNYTHFEMREHLGTRIEGIATD